MALLMEASMRGEGTSVLGWRQLPQSRVANYIRWRMCAFIIVIGPLLIDSATRCHVRN